MPNLGIAHQPKKLYTQLMSWKPIRGYSGLYEISSSGEARRKWWDGRYRPIKPSQSNGYWYFTFCKNGIAKRFRISRLVLQTFVGPSKGKQANHKDGNKNNNCLDNLEWATRVENIQHRIKVLKIDHSIFRRTFTEAQVIEIRNLYANGMKIWDAAIKAGINPNSAYAIVHRRTWRHI